MFSNNEIWVILNQNKKKLCLSLQFKEKFFTEDCNLNFWAVILIVNCYINSNSLSRKLFLRSCISSILHELSLQSTGGNKNRQQKHVSVRMCCKLGNMLSRYSQCNLCVLWGNVTVASHSWEEIEWCL